MNNQSNLNKMKTRILILALLIPFLSQATVWRVNGNEGVDADFADVQTAIDAAEAGDTIYVEPLNSGMYGSITVNKQLVIIGSGYYTFINDSTQYQTNISNINNAFFDEGSAGSHISGCRFMSLREYDGPCGQDANGSIILNDCCITLEGCFSSWGFALGLTSRADNCIITGCYFLRITAQNNTEYGLIDVGGLSLSSCPEAENTGVQGTIITNSVIGPIDGRILTGQEKILSLTVNNCIVVWRGGSQYDTRNTVFTNNIFTNGTTNIVQSNVTFQNNIDIGETVPTGNGNQQNVPFATIFDSDFSDHPELQFKLAESSPALGAATDGTDCGIFGGVEPYKLSGMPNIPSIFELSVGAIGNSNSQTLDVNLKAKSHD
jgi:hypothetical protein